MWSKLPALSCAASTRVFRCSVYPEHLDHAGVVAQCLVELLLAGYALGEVELAADFCGAVEQCHRVAALRRDGGIAKPGRACAYHRDAFG